jgi:hypothetical protein
MLCWMFYPVRSGKRDATSKPTRALNSKADVPHLLMLAHVAHEIVGTGLALEFKSARDTTIETQDEWLRHLNDEEWIILVVRSAEEARVALMRNLDKGLPSL